MIVIGNVLFHITKEYSQRVNDELVAPIARIIKDPDFLKRHKVRIEEKIPDWAQYKKKERGYNIQVAHEARRIKLAQERIDREYRRRVNQSIPRSRGSPSEYITTSAIDFISPIAALLSPKTKDHIELQIEFDHASQMSPTLKLPWEYLIKSELTDTSTLKKLSVYYPEFPKLDTAIKLSYLLAMETEGTITMSQYVPFGDIIITSRNTNPDASFIITDRDGNSEVITLTDLSDEQQSELIALLKANELMCRSA